MSVLRRLSNTLILVLFDIEKEIHVILNREIEADIVGHARLPNTGDLIVLFGAKRRMADVRIRESEAASQTLFGWRG